jgi:putative flavoprotein involved in K+ transport
LLSASLSSSVQVHSSTYRNPAELPAGAVMVVGSGASGCQIAEDLMAGGWQVYLAVGAHRRVPRRYRGRDFASWNTRRESSTGPSRSVPPSECQRS